MRVPICTGKELRLERFQQGDLSMKIRTRVRSRRLAALVAAVVMTASVGVAAVQAVHNAGVLQMDGNAQTSVQSTPPASEDWDLICKANPVTATRADGCTFVAGNSPAGTTTAT